jgi:PBP1b-binding outer membrane lipoprotein LpoB
MRYLKIHTSLSDVLAILLSLVFFTGCDSGKETIDAVTGNQAVKQYQKSEEDIKDIADKQSERLGSIPEDEEDDGEDDEE